MSLIFYRLPRDPLLLSKFQALCIYVFFVFSPLYVNGLECLSVCHFILSKNAFLSYWKSLFKSITQKENACLSVSISFKYFSSVNIHKLLCVCVCDVLDFMEIFQSSPKHVSVPESGIWCLVEISKSENRLLSLFNRILTYFSFQKDIINKSVKYKFKCIVFYYSFDKKKKKVAFFY